MTLSGSPVIILRRTKRTGSRQALQSNITAAKTLAETVKSSFGPKGMDKMLLDPSGNITITNDGATILRKLDVRHPGAKFVIDLAKTQDQEVGDGTSIVVILTGEFLKQAEELIENGIHPSIIIEGYRLATQKSLELIQEIAVDFEDKREKLIQVARTSMASKIVAENSASLAEVVVDAVLNLAKNNETIDIDDILIEKQQGGSITETSLVDGIILDVDMDDQEEIVSIENTRILLLNSELDIQKTKISSTIDIRSAEQLMEVKNQEKTILDKMISHIETVNPGVILNAKETSDKVKTALRKKGILFAKISDKEKKILEKATGASTVTNLKELTENDLGMAGSVKFVEFSGDRYLMIDEVPHQTSPTILIRGGTEFVIDEYERSIHDALCVVRNTIQDGKILYGGGATEVYLYNQLRGYKLDQLPKIQLAIEAYAGGLEGIVATLARNAGIEPIDAIGKLNQKYKKGEYHWGINHDTKDLGDMKELGVVEPLSLKKQALSSASEAIDYLLKIDGIFASKGNET